MARCDDDRLARLDGVYCLMGLMPLAQRFPQAACICHSTSHVHVTLSRTRTQAHTRAHSRTHTHMGMQAAEEACRG